MDTITNLAQSAVKAVWGDGSNRKEPVSGAQGDVAKSEPFDGGNVEADATAASATKDTTPAAEADKQQALDGTKPNPVSGNQVPLAGEPALAKAEPSTGSSIRDSKDVKDTPAKAVVVDQVSMQKPKEVQVPPTKPSAPAKTQPSTTTTTTTTTTKDNKNNAVVVDKAAKKPTTEVPPTKESAPAKSQPSRTADTKDASNVAPVAKKDGEKQVTGSGPKPLATVAKEHGGDAGNAHPDSRSKPKSPEAPKQADAQAKTAPASNKDAQEKGTGDQYVKTSGLAADGGNFDATRPGAGREADRLREEKGLQRETADPSKSPKSDASPSSAANNGHKAHDKPSIKERVKDKLHLSKD